MTNVVPIQQLAAFDEFWNLCPKKVGKPIARAKFDKITNGGLSTRTKDRDSDMFVEIELRATPQEIIEGMKRYRATVGQTRDGVYRLVVEERYICHPATWLNQGRFMDG